ncbi:MAG: endonuclease/exonuclease/phosphatase family protein [Muricoprocola sp.]
MKRTRGLKILLVILLILILCGGGLLLFVTLREYRPQPREELEISEGAAAMAAPSVGDSITLISFNTGYGCQDKDHDSRADGGKMENKRAERYVKQNIAGIAEILKREDADICLLQEVDRDSKRSFYVNQEEYYKEQMPEYYSSYAYNYKCDFIPYPWPPTGKVRAGIMTMSKFPVSSSVRISLPCPFKWPQRTCQLKRCLMMQRIPLEGTDKEFVVINLHLEAYDNGKGKTAQTRVLYNVLMEEYLKGNYCIAGGDFNQSFENVDPMLYPLNITSHFIPGMLTLEGLDGEWTLANDPEVPTSRLLNEPFDPESANTQYYVIDGYILSPNIRVDEVETLDEGFVYTDHNPVKLKVTLLEEGEENK